FVAALLAAAVALAPAAATVAGAIVISDHTQSLLRGTTGQTAPPSTWLSVVPGAGALGLGYAGYVAAPWIATASPRSLAPLAGALVLALAALPAARPLAERTLARATRFVAALDAVKLAHVDLVRARGLERLIGAVLGRRARLVYEKDIALLRRRHP